MLVTPVVYEDEPIRLITLYMDYSHRFNDDERLIARALVDFIQFKCAHTASFHLRKVCERVKANNSWYLSCRDC